MPHILCPFLELLARLARCPNYGRSSLCLQHWHCPVVSNNYVFDDFLMENWYDRSSAQTNLLQCKDMIRLVHWLFHHRSKTDFAWPFSSRLPFRTAQIGFLVWKPKGWYLWYKWYFLILTKLLTGCKGSLARRICFCFSSAHTNNLLMHQSPLV